MIRGAAVLATVRSGAGRRVERTLRRRVLVRGDRWRLRYEAYAPMTGLAAWAGERGLPAAVVAGFGEFERPASNTHRRFAYDVRGAAVIEPTFGWVSSRRRSVLRDSLFYADEVPFGLSEFVHRGARDARQAEVVVSLRDSNEGNFWHFFDDILPKLQLLDELDLAPADAPLLVGRRLWDAPYFQEARTRPGLRDRNFVLQDRPWRAERIVVPGAGSLRLDNLAFSAAQLRLEPPPPDAVAKVFVTRSASRERVPVNISALNDTAAELGYSVVDSDGLSLAEQESCFAGARVVAGLHGAGLANLAWRIGEECSVAEVFRGDFIHPHYAWLAREARFGYGAMVGSPDGSGYHVDVDGFRDLLRQASA